MIKRKFLTTDETIALLGDDAEMLIELVEFHGLRPYVRVDHAKASQVDGDIFEDTLAASGGHDLARWTYFKGRVEADGTPREPRYFLSGWFEVSEESALKYAVRKNVTDAVLCSYGKEGLRHGSFYETGITLNAATVRFKTEDVERYVAQVQLAQISDFVEFQEVAGIPSRPGSATEVRAPGADAPMDLDPMRGIRSDREQTLLRVVAGLWALSELPGEPSTAANKLSALFESWGWEKPSEGTIRDRVLTPAKRLDRIQS